MGQIWDIYGTSPGLALVGLQFQPKRHRITPGDIRVSPEEKPGFTANFALEKITFSLEKYRHLCLRRRK